MKGDKSATKSVKHAAELELQLHGTLPPTARVCVSLTCFCLCACVCILSRMTMRWVTSEFQDRLRVSSWEKST